MISIKFITVFKIFAHPIRLNIIRMLYPRPLSVNELSRKLHKKQSNISQHLQVLKNHNFVSNKRVGRMRMYKLDDSIQSLAEHLMKFKS